MSFELVAPGNEPSNEARSDDDAPKDAWGADITPFPATRGQVAYYHPKGCGEANDAACTPERIRAICHNNSKTNDGKEFPIDGVFSDQKKIRPPFLKGVKHGEKIDGDGNTFVDDGKGKGVCFNDVEGEDEFRKWTDLNMTDPTNREKVVFLSRAPTVRQTVHSRVVAAMRAVKDNVVIPAVLRDDDDDDQFFGSTIGYLLDSDTGEFREVEDTLLADAQKLAEACGALVPPDLSDEEKTIFETFRKEKFDDLWSRSSLHLGRSDAAADDDARSRSMLLKLMRVTNVTEFAHGRAVFEARLKEIPVTKDDMLSAARRGDSAVLKILLDAAKEDDVREVSAKLFAEALDSSVSNVNTVKVLVAHDKVDVNATLTEEYGESKFDEGDCPFYMAIWYLNPSIFRVFAESSRFEPRAVEKVIRVVASIEDDIDGETDKRAVTYMLEMLLSRDDVNADVVNAVDPQDGSTVLHAASSKRDVTTHAELVVRMLLDAGANPLARKRNRNTPIAEADDRQKPALVDLLTVAAATRGLGATRTRKAFPIDRVAEARARLRRGTVRAWLGSREIPSTVVFDPNGERLVVAHAREDREFPEIRGIVELDADTGLRLGNETKFEKSMATTTFSPDGKRIASWNHTSKTFYLESRESGTLAPETTMSYAYRGVYDDAMFSDDGNTFAVADFNGGTVRVWSFKNTKWTNTNELGARTTALAFSRRVGENEYLAVGVSGPILARVWNARFDSRPVDVGSWEREYDFTKKIAFSATGERIAAVSIGEVLKVLESTDGGVSWANTNTVFVNTVFVKEGVSAFAFNPRNSTLLALVIDRNVELWSTYSERYDTLDGTLLRRFKNVEGPLAFSPDGTRLAMVSREDGSIVVENIVETFAKAFLENEKTRQDVDVRGPTREHLEILKHARDVEIRVVLANDTLWKLGPFLPNIERLSLKNLVLPYVGSSTTVPSTIMYIRSLRELDVHGNNLSALPDDLKKLTALRYINLGANYLKEFPKVLEGMPSLRLIQIWDNENGNGDPLVFPSTQFSEALRNKMNKRLLRIDQDGRRGISSELVWGFDGETECENARRLADEDVLDKLRAGGERPKVTHTGTQVLAFLRARYDRTYDDDDKDVEKILSKYFFKEWGFVWDEDEDWSAFSFALGRILFNCPNPENMHRVPSADFRTVGGEGEGAVLSEAGVEEFLRWFVSDDFERDMRECARYVAEADIFEQRDDEIGRKQILDRFRENGFID